MEVDLHKTAHSVVFHETLSNLSLGAYLEKASKTQNPDVEQFRGHFAPDKLLNLLTAQQWNNTRIEKFFEVYHDTEDRTLLRNNCYLYFRRRKDEREGNYFFKQQTQNQPNGKELKYLATDDTSSILAQLNVMFETNHTAITQFRFYHHLVLNVTRIHFDEDLWLDICDWRQWKSEGVYGVVTCKSTAKSEIITALSESKPAPSRFVVALSKVSPEAFKSNMDLNALCFFHQCEFTSYTPLNHPYDKYHTPFKPYSSDSDLSDDDETYDPNPEDLYKE